MNITQLKAELLAARELNTKLHKRLQKCEGADLRLEQVKANMEQNLQRCNRMWDERTDYWFQKYKATRAQLMKLPFYIKWLYKL